jgi:predicted transcriptional regulator
MNHLNMLGGADSPPGDVLENMAYLARSETRIEVLDVLAEDPHTPRELTEKTDIPRSTLRRTLTEMSEREWVERTADGAYNLTATGEHIAVETERYVGAIQAIQVLDDGVAWLPDDELTIGLQHFREATVLRPEPNATSAPSTHASRLMREATEFACLVNIAPSLGFENAMVEGVVDGRLRTKHIITDGELAVLRQNADRASRWQRYIEAGANLYCYDGRIPCNLLVIDETVLILDRQPEAVEGIKSTNDVVRSWAHEMIDAYQEDAERLTTAAFTR